MRKSPQDDSPPGAPVPPDLPPGALKEWAARLAGSRVVASFRRLQRELERVANELEKGRARADHAAVAIQQLLSLVLGMSEVPRRTRRRRSPEELGVMEAEAEAGVSSLQIKRHFDGSGDVSVNGRRSFPLPPKLCELLVILSAAGPNPKDGLADWRSHSTVATALNKRTGGALLPDAVPKIAYKLREAFFEHGENGCLIQRKRGYGVRVTLRK